MEGRHNKDLGDWGEERAVEFLRRHGFEVVDRQFHTVWGEIDIDRKSTRLNSSHRL